MAESKRIFNAGRMNRDLDDRLLPPGEYRDALNIGIGRSEGADVGAVENIKGNHSIGGPDNGITIGHVRDGHTNRFYWFNVENQGMENETSTIWEFDEATNSARIILQDRNARSAPLPTCAPDITARSTEGNDAFGIAPDFPDFPMIPAAQCLDPTAANRYRGTERAYHDQSLCTYVISGCTNPMATNYNPAANDDNGSCIFPPGPAYTFGDAQVMCSVTQDGTVTVTVGDSRITDLTFTPTSVPANNSGGQLTHTIEVNFTIPDERDSNGVLIYSNGGQQASAELANDCFANQPAAAAIEVTFDLGAAPANTTVSGGGIVSGSVGDVVTTDLPTFTVTENVGYRFTGSPAPTFALSNATGIIVGTPQDVASYRVALTSVTIPATSTTITGTWATPAGSLEEFSGFTASNAGATCSPDYLAVPPEAVPYEGGSATITISAGTFASAPTATNGTDTVTSNGVVGGTTATFTFADRTTTPPPSTQIPGIEWQITIPVTAPSTFSNAGATVDAGCTIFQDGLMPTQYALAFTSSVPMGVENVGVAGASTFTGVPGTMHAGPSTFSVGGAPGFAIDGFATASVTGATLDSGTSYMTAAGSTFDFVDNGDNTATVTNIVLAAANETVTIEWMATANSTSVPITVNITAPANSTLPDGSTSNTQTLRAAPGSTQGVFTEFGTAGGVELDPDAMYTPNPGFRETGIRTMGFFSQPPAIRATGDTGYTVPAGIFPPQLTQLDAIAFESWPSTPGTINLSWPSSNIQAADPALQGALWYVWTNGISPPPPDIPGTTGGIDNNAVACGIQLGNGPAFTPAPSRFNPSPRQISSFSPFGLAGADENAELGVIVAPVGFTPVLRPGEVRIDLQNQLSRQQLCANNVTITQVVDGSGNPVLVNTELGSGWTNPQELVDAGFVSNTTDRFGGISQTGRLAGSRDGQTFFLNGLSSSVVSQWPYATPSGYTGPSPGNN